MCNIQTAFFGQPDNLSENSLTMSKYDQIIITVTKFSITFELKYKVL